MSATCVAARGVALLGRRDEPTDAVEEYCKYLGEAMRAHNFDLALERVHWADVGWPAAFADLQAKASAWRGMWVFAQYTALAWSKRGFPLRFLRVLQVLRSAGAHVAVVYHDPDAYTGARWIDRVRRAAQLRTMRRALLACELAIVTVPAAKLRWLPQKSRADERIVFIPVGPNLPLSSPPSHNRTSHLHQPPTIAIYGITGGAAGASETRYIIQAVKLAAQKLGNLRLKAFGRNADCQERVLRDAFRNLPVELDIAGVLPPDEVARAFHASDVFLFVRGHISSARGSAIAGIACGLPVIAYAGPQTAPPITEAGVVSVSENHPQEAGEALVHILSDRSYRETLAAKSQAVYEQHLSWPAIAKRYAEALAVAAAPIEPLTSKQKTFA